MVGMHDLILMVRVQNQASFALSRISRDLTRLETAHTGASRAAIADFNAQNAGLRRLQQQSQAISHVGRVAQMAGVAGAVGFGLMARSAAQFNTQATMAATQTGKINSGANVIIANAARIEKAVRQQMMDFPSSSQDMTSALYDIYSSTNIAFGQGLKLLKLFNQGVVAGGGPAVVSLTDISGALITLANNWNINVNDMSAWHKMMNSTLATVRFGRLTLQQYTSTMNQLAPAFRRAGESIPQLNAGIAFQTRLMPSQRFSATALARMVEMLQRMAPALKQKFGVSILDAKGNLLGLDQVFERLIKRWPQLRTNATFAADFFKMVTNTRGTIQAGRAWTAFLQHFQLYKQVLHATQGDQKEFNRSLAAMEKSTGIRWEVFVNRLKAVALEIGADVIPAFQKLGGYVTKAVNWFDSLSPHTKKMIADFALWGSIAAVVGGSFAVIAGGIGSLVTSLILIGRVSRFTSGAGGGGIFGMLMGERGSASGAMVALLAAIPLLIRYHRYLGDIWDIGRRVTNAIGGLRVAITMLTAATLAFKAERLVTDIMSIGTTSSIAAGEVKGLRAAILSLGGLGGLGLTGIFGRLGSIASRFAPELVAFPDMLDVLAGKDPFSSTAGKKGVTPIGQALSDLAQKGTDKYRKMLYDFNSLNARTKALSRRYGATTPYGVIQEFWSGKMTAKQFDQFANQLMTTNKKIGEAILPGGLGGQKTLLPVTGLLPKWAQGLDKISSSTVRNATANQTASRITHTHVRSVQDWIRAMEKAQNLKLLHPNDLQIAKQYEILQAALQARFKNNKTELAAINDVLSAYDSNLKKATKDTQTLSTTSADVINGLQSMYSNLLQTNQQMLGQLFQGPFLTGPRMQRELQVGYRPTGADLIKDARLQLKQYRFETHQLNRLAAEGAPVQLLQQLEALDPKDAIQKMRALGRLAPGELHSYFNLINQQQALVHKRTMQQLDAQLQDYRKYGKQTALQIVAGIKDAYPDVNRELRAMLNRIFGGGAGSSIGRGGSGTHNSHNKNNSDNVTFNVTVHGGEHMTKAQLQHAMWVAYQRHRHKR
jgi:hypothetical protein